MHGGNTESSLHLNNPLFVCDPMHSCLPLSVTPSFLFSGFSADLERSLSPWAVCATVHMFQIWISVLQETQPLLWCLSLCACLFSYLSGQRASFELLVCYCCLLSFTFPWETPASYT